MGQLEGWWSRGLLQRSSAHRAPGSPEMIRSRLETRGWRDAQVLSWPLAPISSASIVPGSWSGQKSRLQSSFQHLCTAEFGRCAQPHVPASHGAQAWLDSLSLQPVKYKYVRHRETSVPYCMDISVAMAPPGRKAVGGGPGRSWQSFFCPKLFEAQSKQRQPPGCSCSARHAAVAQARSRTVA